jgi:hypothetical protein
MKIDFKHLVVVVAGLWFLRIFVAGPFEPCFFITGILSTIIAIRWKGARRITGIVFLLISLVGLTLDISTRIGERRMIKERHDQIIQHSEPSK